MQKRFSFSAPRNKSKTTSIKIDPPAIVHSPESLIDTLDFGFGSSWLVLTHERILEEGLINLIATEVKPISNFQKPTKDMLFRTLAIAAALCASSVNGFASTRSPVAARSNTALNIMTAAELDAIIDEAESCANGECALDEVDNLVNNLLEQQKMLNKRIGEIDELVKELEHLNGRDNRPTDEVRDTVKAIFRIFALGVSNLFFHCLPLG
jgi:hypothetical protein